MRKTLIGVLLVLAILSFSQLALADTTYPSEQLSETVISAEIELGPGSTYPIMSPIESNYVWVSSVEPTKAIWKIYDPHMHLITTITHIPSVKYQHTDGNWHFTDSSAFTLPAFAQKGTWLAECSFQLADGSIQYRPISAEDSNVRYLGIPCTAEGDIFGNIFLYPWYLFGTEMPAYFWFPGVILWLPLAWIAFCAIFSRSIGGFVDMTKQMLDSGRKQRGKLRRSRAKRS